MKILLPDTVPLDPTLPEGWEAVTVDARAEIPAAHHDAEVLVVWGASRRHLASAAEQLGELKLVQSLSAVPTDGRDKPLEDVVSESVEITEV